MPTPLPAPTDVSAQAAALIGLTPAMASDTLRSIEQVLAASLAAPTPRELREARLGLLLNMLREGTGEVPTADSYNLLRTERAEQGESWPHSTTLLRAYSTWQTAVRAAMKLLWDGPSARVAHTHVGKGRADRYERADIYRAIQRFHGEHAARWPTSTQFYEWGRQLRRLARQGGHPDPRVPTSGVVQRHFPSFAAALAGARRDADDRDERR